MSPAAVPPDEASRLDALRRYEVLDTLGEEVFDDLTDLAASVCGAPMALISFVDEHRQWFKSRVGLAYAETSRDVSFCSHAIHGHDLFIVEDATRDERFLANPLVVSNPKIRFYAGAPLVTPEGHALGTLCVMDREPKQLSAAQRHALQVLSRQVMAQLELRRSLSGAGRARHALLSLLEDQKRVGESLRESEARFRQLAENINEVFWMFDVSESQLLYIGPGYEKIWGRSCESLYASPGTWLDAIHPDDRSRVEQSSMNLQDGALYDEEYRVVRPDWSVRWVHDRGFPVRDAGGTVYRIVGVVEDVTDRRQLESQLRQSQKLESIGQLAAGVAHDFNNILMVIQGHATLLLTSGAGVEKPEDHAEQIVLAAERAASLTRQLLLFSRRTAMQLRVVNLNEIVTSLVRMLQRILGEDVHMHLNLHPEPLLTRADAGMLGQVLMNLAVNARDAMPTGGRLTIETTACAVTAEEAHVIPDGTAGPHVCIVVTDTGSGIARNNLARIFEPFFTTKEPGKGTGLGLATAFGIVKQHGGWLKVDSEVGKGSSFQVFLPPTESAVEPQAPESPRPVTSAGGETILVVEDEPSVRLLTRIVLERQGYQVVEASYGAEALRVFDEWKGQVHLLLTDMVMPEGMSGRQLAAQLRERNPNLKVIYTSGYSPDLADPELKLQEGQNFLQKPCPPQQLLETVRKRLNG